jgi:hypothetical protein
VRRRGGEEGRGTLIVVEQRQRQVVAARVLAARMGGGEREAGHLQLLQEGQRADVEHSDLVVGAHGHDLVPVFGHVHAHHVAVRATKRACRRL